MIRNKYEIHVKPRLSRYILVDYDNLVKSVGGAHFNLEVTLNHVVNALNSKTDFFADVDHIEDVAIRLYGGWYEEKQLTRMAQETQSEIRSFTSGVFSVASGSKVNIKVELALSMMATRGRALYATCRRRDLSEAIDVPSPSCCELSHPHFEYLRDVLREGKCSNCGRNLLARAFKVQAQKMVDAMIFCDCAQLASEDMRTALVSADSDMIPVLIYLSQGGRRVYHVWPPNKRDELKFVRDLLGRSYVNVEW